MIFPLSLLFVLINSSVLKDLLESYTVSVSSSSCCNSSSSFIIPESNFEHRGQKPPWLCHLHEDLTWLFTLEGERMGGKADWCWCFYYYCAWAGKGCVWIRGIFKKKPAKGVDGDTSPIVDLTENVVGGFVWVLDYCVVFFFSNEFMVGNQRERDGVAFFSGFLGS